MLDRNFVLNQSFKDTDISQYLMSLYNIVVTTNAQTVVELGAGESSFTLTAGANRTGGKVYSIDVGGWGTVNRFQPDGEVMLKSEKSFLMITGNDLEVVKSWEKPIDLLFLDTSHLYEQTKEEIRVWFPWVKSGGLIVMHDTGHEAGDGMGCGQALREFLADHSDYRAAHLMDTKLIGLSLIFKL